MEAICNRTTPSEFAELHKRSASTISPQGLIYEITNIKESRQILQSHINKPIYIIKAAESSNFEVV